MTTRERMVELVPRAYSSITIVRLSQLLGMAPEETLNFCRNKSWQLNPDSSIVYPVEIEQKSKASVLKSELAGSLIDYISFMEN